MGRKINRPLVLVMYENRRRSPLATQFYESLKTSDCPTYVVVADAKLPIKDVVRKWLGGKIPDYIYLGFGHSKNTLFKYLNYVWHFKINVIMEVGDAQCFNVDKWKHFVTHFIGRMPTNWEMYSDLKSHIPKAQFVHIPWGIDTGLYKDKGLKRDVDVAMICSIGETWQYHARRRMIRKILPNMPITRVVGRYYGDRYIELLNRSKISIVDTSGRKALVQKYLEGACCGPLLIGEKPLDKNNLFEDGVSFIEADPSDIRDKILYYLQHDDERIKIAKECRNRVIKYHELQDSVNTFHKFILEDFDGSTVSRKGIQI